MKEIRDAFKSITLRDILEGGVLFLGMTAVILVMLIVG